VDPVAAIRLAAVVKRVVPWRRVFVVGAGFLTFMGLVGVTAFTSLLGSGDSSLSSGLSSCINPNVGVTSATLNSRQMANAAAIIAEGQRLGIPERGWIIAIATAMQESKLDNTLTPAQSDRDSAGMFQQRAPWGTLADRMDPAISANMFYQGGHGGQPGLKSVANWVSLPLAKAAQAVQVSAFPGAYAKWEVLATETVARILAANGVAPTANTPATTAPTVNPVAGLSLRCTGQATIANWTSLAGTTPGERAVNAAAQMIDMDYSWGGGNFDGPTKGIAQGANTIGFDCSGLVRYGWYVGTSGAIQFPHSSKAIAADPKSSPIAPNQIQAGDILSFATEGGSGLDNVSHDGLADGRGGMVHAPHTGAKITYIANVLGNTYYSSRLVSITRPNVPPAAP
jgi:cell wall-associated NlpC family hydrolase